MKLICCYCKEKSHELSHEEFIKHPVRIIRECGWIASQHSGNYIFCSRACEFAFFFLSTTIDQPLDLIRDESGDIIGIEADNGTKFLKQ